MSKRRPKPAAKTLRRKARAKAARRAKRRAKRQPQQSAPWPVYTPRPLLVDPLSIVSILAAVAAVQKGEKNLPRAFDFRELCGNV